MLTSQLIGMLENTLQNTKVLSTSVKDHVICIRESSWTFLLCFQLPKAVLLHRTFRENKRATVSLSSRAAVSHTWLLSN